MFHPFVQKPRVCAMTLTNGHISKVKVTLLTLGKLVCGPELLTVMLDPEILHTMVVHDPRMCHDFDPRSYLQQKLFKVKVTMHS